MIFMKPYSGCLKRCKLIKKETIGKIQLTLGIILLVGAILGGVYTYQKINEEKEDFTNLFALDDSEHWKFNSSVSNESKLALAIYRTDLIMENKFSYEDQLASLQYSLIIIILLSLMMILQGLANRGDKK